MASNYRSGTQNNIAEKLSQDHARIYAGLTAAMNERGAIGDAAAQLSQLCVPHFELEEERIWPVFVRLDHVLRDHGHEETGELGRQLAELRRQHEQFAAEHRALAFVVDALAHAAHQEDSGQTLALTEMIRNHEAFEDQWIWIAANQRLL